jgi:hypothetical protein
VTVSGWRETPGVQGSNCPLEPRPDSEPGKWRDETDKSIHVRATAGHGTSLYLTVVEENLLAVRND